MLGAQYQPLCLLSACGRRPVAASVAGERFVAFRGADGTVAVFQDRCPHRGMKLSEGSICKGRLTCPYHGWSFDAQGTGSSPGNPALRPRLAKIDSLEAGGVLWVRRSRPESAELPALAVAGHDLVHRAFRDIDVPMLAVLDNFTEIEHTGTGHWEFGFSTEELHKIAFRSDIRPDRSTAVAAGWQKKLSLISRLALGVRTGDRLTITIDTRYAPLHVNYEWWWQDRASGAPKGFRFREIAFFAPLDAGRSRLVAYYFWTMPRNGRLGLNRLLKQAAAQVIRYEIALDIALCTGLCEGALTLKDCRLSRLDALLPAHRRQLSGELERLEDAAA